jgi:crotonobetainyl-CoA:carnitine CoA-transferase CaiB-like acyl-CoA transferase
MVHVLQGVRVLEVAQYVFIPSAGAILAEWGADVIKIEHPVRGDAQRGLARASGLALNEERNPVLEHANSGKRSVGIDIATPEGQALLYEIAKTSDVFMTNYLPSIRKKLGIDVEQLRAINPGIIYVRGSAYGDKGAERDVGGFDFTAFWARSGIGYSMTPEELEVPLMPSIGGFGDSIAAMNIVAGITGALFHLRQTGQAVEVDVSLLSTAWWSAGVAVNQASLTGKAPKNRMPKAGGSPGNPFTGRPLPCSSCSLALTSPACSRIWACRIWWRIRVFATRRQSCRIGRRRASSWLRLSRRGILPIGAHI